MLHVLFIFMIAGIPYKVVNSCHDIGGLYFYRDDSQRQRMLSICTEYGPQQTSQIVTHELVHACMHVHEHNYSTDEELQKHLNEDKYSEEQVAVMVGSCFASNEQNLLKELRDHNVNVY